MMKRSKRFAELILTGVMAVTTLFGCGSSSGGAASDSSAADSSSKKVLKWYGMCICSIQLDAGYRYHT